MSHQEQGLRVRRTQKLLREALIELIEERGFDSLTVGEITERALVSRAAFYRNYKDKYDLVEQIYDEAMDSLLKAVAESNTHSLQIWESFFEHINEYDRLYGALLGRKGSPWFVLKMRASMLNMVKGWQPATIQHIYPISDELIPDLVATMLVEAITWWLENGKPYSTTEMTRRCGLLVIAIFNETMTWDKAQ